MRAGLLLALLALAACKQEMTQQRRYDTYEPAPLWADGASARPLPMGVVARGDLAREAAAAEPPEVTPALLARGQERFGIYCAPCHGPAGDGDGMIPRRGFPHPPSYHTARLRAAPAGYIFGVITRGYGVMYGYAARVEPADRWAIIAYIRALQLSRGVELASIPDARERLP
ncbi:cytochrome c [Siccirubricoccus sp. G192]|uniref:c-type cytochrome n=1 Tax=Siccirubricoccus sp. G192 TaxID=2849651 RepID=UPI001C2C93AE|nr:cytochrome c [Siccirubricoccus sp. G192]MBV1795661.1 c-type cytochrome [Siccirubricoccus sp. G192]